MAFGANDPQYSAPGAPSSRQAINSIPRPSKGSKTTRYSVLSKIASARRAGTPGSGTSAGPFPAIRSLARNDRPDFSTAAPAGTPSDDRSFSAVPSRSTGGISAKTMARPASETSTPPYRGALSEIGAAESPLSSRQAPATKYTSPGTEDNPDALAAGRASMKRSDGGGGPVGPFGKRNGTGPRSPRKTGPGPNALGD